MLKGGEIDTDASWELVDGEIVWLSPANPYHGATSALIAASLVSFARVIGAWVLTADPGFMVGSDFQQLRAPDVALVTRERLGILQHGST